MDIKEIKEYLEKVKPPTNDNWIPLQPWWEYLQFLLKRVEELELRLNSWALELKLNSWVCAYCGQRFPKDVLMAPLEVANHTLTCDKNPMVEELRQVKSCLKKLKEIFMEIKISRYDRHHLDMDESKDGKYVLYSDYEGIMKQLKEAY